MADRDEEFIAGLSEPERTFGAWLASKLDEDDWNKAEPMMLAALRQAREEGRKEQPITAETVRLQCRCFTEHDRQFCATRNICRPMAEAQRANQGVSHEG